LVDPFFDFDWPIGRLEDYLDWRIDSLSTIKSFEDLPVWQDARMLNLK